MEQYYECLVARKVNPGVRVLAVLLGVLAFFFLASAFVITPYVLPLAAVMGLLAWLVYGRSRVEYEYLVMQDTVTVDIIYNRSKRRQLGEYSIRSVCMFAPESAEQLFHYRGSGVRNFSTARAGDKHYVMVCREDGRTALVKLTPDEGMLELMKQLLPVGAFVRS